MSLRAVLAGLAAFPGARKASWAETDNFCLTDTTSQAAATATSPGTPGSKRRNQRSVGLRRFLVGPRRRRRDVEELARLHESIEFTAVWEFDVVRVRDPTVTVLQGVRQRRRGGQ